MKLITMYKGSKETRVEEGQVAVMTNAGWKEGALPKKVAEEEAKKAAAEEAAAKKKAEEEAAAKKAAEEAAKKNNS